MKNKKRFVFRNEQVVVHQIYSIAKQIDAMNFRTSMFNHKQLFHGSKYNNFLGDFITVNNLFRMKFFRLKFVYF